MPSHWEFWIDVGGTFTDCLARRPDGVVLRRKLLSSGVVKGKPAVGSRPDRICDPLRSNDTVDFWSGFQLTLFDARGQSMASSRVASNQGSSSQGSSSQGNSSQGPSPSGQVGALQLDAPLLCDPLLAASYELSSNFDAPILAVRMLMGLPMRVAVPPIALRLGTTKGTNALLTRTGARTALLVTQGFGDLLEIGYQDRPQLFELAIRKPVPLAYRTIEIAERMAADGTVLVAPDPVRIGRQLSELRVEGCESLAICLLHADLYPDHEQQVAQLAREAGFAEISCSRETSPLARIVARGETTVVDAYLNPVLRLYLARLQSALPDSEIHLMTSSGGLADPETFRGCHAVLSGPAGGAVGYAKASAAAGFDKAIGFDMGGTSTDVSRYAGELELQYETRKAGVRLMAPVLAIDTVASGGGSICTFDGVRLVVGPQSAGADPGPACYGRGGPLTVADLNFYLGRLPPDRFPFALSRIAVEERLAALIAELAAAGQTLTGEELASGLLQIANANIARAIRNVTVAKGYDPREHVLTSFGGGGGQHACAVADELGIASILDPVDAGVLSAAGIGQADVSYRVARGVGKPAESLSEQILETLFDELEIEPLDRLREQGFSDERIMVRRSLEVRYEGVEATLETPWTRQPAPGDVPWREAFFALHRRQFGYLHAERALEVVVARVAAFGLSSHVSSRARRVARRLAQSPQVREVWFGGSFAVTPLFDRTTLSPGDWFVGPAVVAGDHSTLVVESGWEAELLSTGDLVLTRSQPKDDDSLADAPSDPQVATAKPVLVEIFHNLLAGVAERMGRVLERTALSVNVKERLDYSCALFTGDGDLVANAPHVPVHLGAMSATVKAVVQDNPQMRQGDVYVTNDPYAGGSHLPDITVVQPVYVDATTMGPSLNPSTLATSPTFFTAVRAHHAEIGGVRPGSMPPLSRKLGDEGVVIENFLLVRDGVSHADALRDLLANAPFPSRAVEENMADLRAQLAAAQQGANDLIELANRFGVDAVIAQMHAVQQTAETLVRRAVAKLPVEVCAFADRLELSDGRTTPVQVRIERLDLPSQGRPPQGRERYGPALRIDFSGSGPVVDGNLNANRAIVSAAVLYVLRLLVDQDLPLNEGALRAVEIVVPPGLLNPPPGPMRELAPAVAAGNVETSQRVVDVMLGALGLAAASQGTMNNLVFGNQHFGCYETIGGGSGAVQGADGAHAVQVHMTNTRATDPEILERRLPVRLWEFSVRRGSGGRGRWCGGDGIVRRIEFLTAVELSLITQRRGEERPFGMAGGLPGAAGVNRLIRADGSEELLPAISACALGPGDQIEILTPGGGGFGPP